MGCISSKDKNQEAVNNVEPVDAINKTNANPNAKSNIQGYS